MEQSAPLSRRRDISSEWFHALVESALDGVVTMDDKGRIIAVNPAAEKIFGYRSHQVTGRLVSDTLIPPQLRKAHEQGLARFLAGGEKKIIGSRMKVTAMRADHSIFPAELEVISINPQSAPVFIAYFRDISEREQLEKELRQSVMNTKKTLHLAAAIGEVLKLADEFVEGIFLGALIHDIGKIAVPSEILSRPGKLMDEDLKYLKIHCHKGYEILHPVSFPWPVAEIALQHHEHLDGSGYPQGLKGDNILFEARIVCVADVVESLTAHRPYRPAHPIEDALASINRRCGRWYDQRVVNACTQLFEAGYSIDTIDMDKLTWLSS